MLFYVMCSLTGLFVIDYKPYGDHSWKSAIVYFFRTVAMVWSAVLMLIFILVNFGALVFDIYAIAWCPYPNCEYIYSSIASITNNTNHSETLGVPQPEKPEEYQDWKKTLVTTVIVASLVSYYIMVIRVLPTLPESRFSILKPLHKCITKTDGNEVLSPFVDSMMQPTVVTNQGQPTVVTNQGQPTVVTNQGQPTVVTNQGQPTVVINQGQPTVVTNQGQPTLLRPVQARRFHLMFWFTVLLYVSNTVVFIVHLSDLISPDHVKEDIDILGLTMHLSAQLGVIPCCFIFSKVAYAVSTKCLHLEKEFKAVQWEQPVPTREVTQSESERHAVQREKHVLTQETESERRAVQREQHVLTQESESERRAAQREQPVLTQESESERHAAQRELRESVRCAVQREQRESERHAKNYLKRLKSKDKNYLKMFKATLKPYETWFAWHWILFIFVTFMSIAYLAETIVQERYGTGSKCADGNHTVCMLDLVHIIIFVLQSCVLFLYPCFRAGTITASREILISRVSRSNWEEVPQSVKDSFVQYLKDQNCGFKILLMCARIEFGFNLAYLSIFIGVLGVILRLSL